MLNWSEFEQLRVIKKLRAIISHWWNVEIFFVEEHGELRNLDRANPPSLKNPVVEMLLKKDAGYELLQNFSVRILDEAKTAKSFPALWDTGLRSFVAPINIDNAFSGMVLATGFFTEDTVELEKESLYRTLRDFGYVTTDIEKAVSSINTITNDQIGYFRELVELVASEVETLNEEISSRENKISELNKELGTRYRYDNMIGKSAQMQEMYNLLDKIKNSHSTVLIQGDNGTGKELIAKAIHYNSTRKTKVFVVQNCSAFNDNLLESELFGHVKGAFTGAIKDKKGLFEIANGGTFFLDEIGDMSLAMQVKILRVLQEGTFIPVGGTEPRKVDVRIIAATNKDLKDMIAKGLFREDLYYRINVINIVVPRLRDRKDDIHILAEYFLEKAYREKGFQKKMLSKKTLERMLEYEWPGNIRELENEIERLVVLVGDSPIIEPELLSARIRETTDKKSIKYGGKLKDAMETMEVELIREGLKRMGWNKSKLAKELGISRASLIAKVEKYGLDKRKMSPSSGGSENNR